MEKNRNIKKKIPNILFFLDIQSNDNLKEDEENMHITVIMLKVYAKLQ